MVLIVPVTGHCLLFTLSLISLSTVLILGIDPCLNKRLLNRFMIYSLDEGQIIYKYLSAGSVNFHAKLKIHSTWGSTDLDEIYTVCRLYRVYSIPKIFLKNIT